MTLARESEFNGKPMLGLYRDEMDQFGLKFGLKKAKLIMEHIEAIRAFIDKYDKIPAQAR